jgi:hypothetical protein
MKFLTRVLAVSLIPFTALAVARSATAAVVFLMAYLLGLLAVDVCARLTRHRPPSRRLLTREREWPPGRLPAVLLGLAVRRAPVAVRDELRGEWFAELHEILLGREARPVLRTYHAVRYAIGLVRAAPRLNGDPAAVSAPTRSRTIGRPRRIHTGWAAFFEDAYQLPLIAAIAVAAQEYVLLFWGVPLMAVVFGWNAWEARSARRIGSDPSHGPS